MSPLPQAVIITGGTKRIGFHLAQASLDMGLDVILHFRSGDRSARQWLERRPEYNGRVHFIRMDLTDRPERLIEKTLLLPCRLTGLVNNASVFSKGDLSDIAHLKAMLDIHFFAPALLGARFAEQVKNDSWIINITDALAARPNPAWQNYRMSKMFLEELTRQQAIRFAPRCRVNAIAPGAVLPSRGSSRAAFDALADKIPLRKTAPMQSLIEAYRFLATNTSCTGQVVKVDGGWSLTA